jgi:hypothetical protein
LSERSAYEEHHLDDSNLSLAELAGGNQPTDRLVYGDEGIRRCFARSANRIEVDINPLVPASLRSPPPCEVDHDLTHGRDSDGEKVTFVLP